MDILHLLLFSIVVLEGALKELKIPDYGIIIENKINALAFDDVVILLAGTSRNDPNSFKTDKGRGTESQ